MAKLNKKLTLYGLTMIAIGSCIGSGIFVSPAQIVGAVDNHLLVLLVWLLGGLIALTGALTFAELGSMFPKSGGVYVFLKEAYGDFWGFLFGWAVLLVITTGALAALGMAFAEYMSFFYPFSQSGKVGLACTTIILLTGINMVGVSTSQLFANVFTGLKLLAIIAIIIAGFAYYDPAKVPLDFSLTNTPDNLVGAVLIALIGVLWSVGGWHHASYLSGEAIDAKRNVPRAMIIGVFVVMVTYLLVNMSYMMLLPLNVIAGTERVAGDAIATIIPFGGKLVAVAIAISIFGTIGIYTMSAPRIYFAMARDGVFFEKLAYIHPTYRTPIYAMALQAVWAVVLLLFWGSFQDLITYVTFMDIVFLTMAGISIFVFRAKRKDHPRPVRTLGYPIVPLIFILTSIAFLISTFIERPTQVWAGLILVAMGWPVYYYFKKRK